MKYLLLTLLLTITSCSNYGYFYCKGGDSGTTVFANSELAAIIDAQADFLRHGIHGIKNVACHRL
jgi:hypothetical protein